MKVYWLQLNAFLLYLCVSHSTSDLVLSSHLNTTEERRDLQINPDFVCENESSFQEIFDIIISSNKQNNVETIFCEGFEGGLFGSFPADIPSMPNLKRMYLFAHQGLTGTMPDSFFDLTALTEWYVLLLEAFWIVLLFEFLGEWNALT